MSRLNSMVRLIFLFTSLLSFQVVASDIEYSQRAESTLNNQQSEEQRISSNAALWNVSEKEWTKYETIMKSEGKYHWKDVDPIMVLGMYAKTESEKKRFAIRMAKKEYRLNDMFVKFNRAYMKEFQVLFGHEKIIDLNMLNEQVSDNAVQSSLLPGIDNKPKSRITSLGDKYVLFISTDCSGCDAFYNKLLTEQSFGSSIDIYFVGDNKESIGLWAKDNKISPDAVKSNSITLNLAGDTYDKFNRPALPSAFYYDKKNDTVLSYKLD